MDYDPATIEARWRTRWADEGWYEADPSDDPADTTYVTVAYPYPSGAMHVGHCRTYTVPDVYARFRRMCGDQVLFPMAWHVTGTPIIGAVERLKNREPDQVRILTEVFGVDETEFPDLETPMGFAQYFIDNHYKQGMQQLGLSIDWRREFTTNDDHYSAFISWQYETLHDRGLLEKGLHPVNFCTNEEQPVTTHDILEGEEAEFQEFTLVKFAADGTIFPMGTLRPETVRGVTNAFVNPDATYVRATVDGEEWVIAEDAVEKLQLQRRSVSLIETLDGADLVGERVTNPVTGDELVVLPADFVDTDSATGVVMSVPAHSPDDWVALTEVKAAADELEPFGIDPDEVRSIEPIAILTIEGYGEFPAVEAVATYGVTESTDPALADATTELYNREFHQGVLSDAYGEFGGEVVEDVRDVLREQYQRDGAFDAMYDFTEEVICRCGGDIEVSEQDTWFIRYNDEAWRSKTRAAIDRLNAVPSNTRERYYHTVDWLEEWPCIRNYGLGTRLPWDDEFVIEPLSDSTIYMAYYTIAHQLRDVPVESLDRAFFDALFLDEEDADLPARLREEWEYWYPVTVRFSAPDLVTNHLTFYLYHHAEFFAEHHWPDGITVMGMGLLEGESMSSSRGHVALATETIERFGADTVRFFLLNSSEPWQDFDWREEEVTATANQLERFWNRSVELIEAGDGARDLETIDRWLLAKLHEVIAEVTDAMAAYETRTASQAAFYRFEEHLRWYRRRTDVERPGAVWTLRTVLETRLRLLSPIIPFMTNELHERLTGESAERAGWPAVDESMIDESLLAGEDLLRELVEDIRSIVDVIGTDPEQITIYTGAEWKRAALDAVLDTDAQDHGAVMGSLMQEDRFRERGEAVAGVVGDLIELVRERSPDRLAAVAAIDERATIDAATAFLEREFEAEVAVYSEDEDPPDPGDRAKNALPGRPAIHLEAA